MKVDPYKILDRDFSTLSETEKLVVWKIRKWMRYPVDAFPSEPPTPKSIARIEKQLGLQIPKIYIELAKLTPNYGVWFGSIGPDYASHNHILTLNTAFHRGNEESAALPVHFVMLNHGHDGACDCWNLLETISDEHPIYYINVDSRSKPKLLAESFVNYWTHHA